MYLELFSIVKFELIRDLHDLSLMEFCVAASFLSLDIWKHLRIE